MTVHGVLWGIYVVGFLLNWRRTVYWMVTDGDPEAEVGIDDVVGGVMFGTLGATLWPLLVVGRAVRTVYRSHTEGFIKLMTPRHVWRERELHAREERIAALEDEVGIHG